MQVFIAKEINEDNGFLRPDEAHHVAKVLRMQSGQEVGVTQGNGKIYQARLELVQPKQVQFSILNVLREQETNGLHIAIAPTKSNDRFEFFLEKATEIGIEEITPIICQRSERKVYKTERGQKIIESACKQSKKAVFPKFNAPIKFADFVKNLSSENAFIAHLNEGKTQSIFDLDFSVNASQKACFIIGPEGDFHPTEVEWAEKKGIQNLSLGNEVLRTETAGIFVANAWALKTKR